MVINNFCSYYRRKDREEVDDWVENFSDGKWRDYAQQLLGFKSRELDKLEEDPRQFLTFILILSKMICLNTTNKIQVLDFVLGYVRYRYVTIKDYFKTTNGL